MYSLLIKMINEKDFNVVTAKEKKNQILSTHFIEGDESLLILALHMIYLYKLKIIL
jgi:hypothetical protein